MTGRLMRGVTGFAALLIASPAVAITPLDQAGSMAAQAGEMIGAAAGCGVRESRLAPVRLKVIRIIRASGASPASLDRVPSIFDAVAARASNAATSRPDLCPSALAAFEKAERD